MESTTKESLPRDSKNQSSVFAEHNDDSTSVQESVDEKLCKDDDTNDDPCTEYDEDFPNIKYYNYDPQSSNFVKLAMWDFGQCDPKKCSKILSIKQCFKGIMLSPQGVQSVSPFGVYDYCTKWYCCD